MIISEDEKVKHIKHIIKTPSEVKFIQDLDAYIKTPDNQFLDFDWWLFSKIDESLDDVYIPCVLYTSDAWIFGDWLWA